MDLGSGGLQDGARAAERGWPRGRGVVFTCGRYFLWEQIRLGEGKCSVPGECRGARKMTPHTSAPTPTTTTNAHTQTGRLYTSCFIFLTCLPRWYSTRCGKMFPTIKIYLLPCMVGVWLIVSCCFHLHLIVFFARLFMLLKLNTLGAKLSAYEANKTVRCKAPLLDSPPEQNEL